MKRIFPAGIVAILISTTLIAGCSEYKEARIWNNGITAVESRRWIGAQIDAVIRAANTSGNWKDYEWADPVEWSDKEDERVKLLDGLGAGYCGKQQKEDIDTRQFGVILKNSDSGNGAPEIALRVSKFLESNGWAVHLSPKVVDDDWEVFASRPDRASVELRAFSHGLSLSVDAPCTFMSPNFGGLDRDTVPSVLDPVVKDFRRLPSTKEERAAWSPMQRDPKEEQHNRELEEEPK